jgi:Protein of unknown function (DUF3467)
MSSEDTRAQALHRHRGESRYANSFQIGYNAFEFLIEFGQQNGGIHTSIYVSPQHARILANLLGDTLRQYDDTFSAPPNMPPKQQDVC